MSKITQALDELATHVDTIGNVALGAELVWLAKKARVGRNN